MHDEVASTGSPNSPKLLLIVLVAIVSLIGCAIGGVWLYNETELDKPLQRVLLSDPRNHIVQASAHFDGWVDTSTVVFDLRDISGETTKWPVVPTQLVCATPAHRLQTRRSRNNCAKPSTQFRPTLGMLPRQELSFLSTNGQRTTAVYRRIILFGSESTREPPGTAIFLSCIQMIVMRLAEYGRTALKQGSQAK